MSRYLIKFRKQGLIKYTSHLDLMRLFQRAFKRGNILLEYSQGFNPHPKMSFAHPLSLGFTSIGEYLEINTAQNYDTDEIIEALNRSMPEGLEITACRILPENGKTMAALVTWATYHISMPIPTPQSESSLGDHFRSFLSKEEIIGMKRMKGTGGMTEIDMKPLIKSGEVLLDAKGQNNMTVAVTMRAGSAANLNPEVFIKAFLASEHTFEPDELLGIERQDLMTAEGISIMVI